MRKCHSNAKQILPLKHVTSKQQCVYFCVYVFFKYIPTQTVCTPASQRPPSGQAGLWEWAPGKPGSTVVPTCGLASLKPCEHDTLIIIFLQLAFSCHFIYRAKRVLTKCHTIVCKAVANVQHSPVVRPHAAVDHSYVFSDGLHFMDALFIIQYGLLFFLCCQDNAIGSWKSRVTQLLKNMSF